MGCVFGDMPTNCTYDETIGDWTFYLGKDGQTNQVDCNDIVEPIKTLRVKLLFPNHVVDEYGNEGTWTMIYNQGLVVFL